MKKTILLFCLLGLILFSMAQNGTGFQFVERPEKKQVDVLYNGKLLTAYCYYDSVMKPVLWPVNTVDGITVTRGYPLNPQPNEPTDHPHHIGIWMNYESVNGLDFWNSSTAIPPDKRNMYGTVLHQKFVDKKAEKDKASLTTTANWVRPDGKVLMNEKITYNFQVKGNQLFIDRISTLTANDIPVVFKDVKDGFFAIRVARELQMPTQEASTFTDVHGNKTTVANNNEGVSGMYYSSNGLKGDSVWSSKGPWTMLTGRKEGKDITIGMFDHPSNVGYPTYWHARGYGLFALNPLGRQVFSNGKEELNFTLSPGASTTFRYRVVVTSDKLTMADMNKMTEDFRKEK
ncbi:MAG: PmoA family protein [Flavisolibacter sp.]|nr:PmoA family protein [Flavisolibacter sp.]